MLDHFFFHLPAAFGGIHRYVAYRRKLNSDFSSLYGSCGCEIDADPQTCQSSVEACGSKLSSCKHACLGQLQYYGWHSSPKFFHE